MNTSESKLRQYEPAQLEIHPLCLTDIVTVSTSDSSVITLPRDDF